MKGIAQGSFEVKMVPQPATVTEGSAPNRFLLEKQFHGDLEADSQGEMLAAMTGVKGSAGYVAIERVTGTLAGRTGSFFLQHFGLMDRGSPLQNVVVVPDSGSGHLEGLTGMMVINIDGGKHAYDLSYSLPDEPVLA